MTECDFMNTYHVDADMQALALIKSNIMQFSIFMKFSNSNSIKIKIISIEEITFYDKSQAAKQFQKVVSELLKI